MFRFYGPNRISGANRMAGTQRLRGITGAILASIAMAPWARGENLADAWRIALNVNQQLQAEQMSI